jgi:hypothetical protein
LIKVAGYGFFRGGGKGETFIKKSLDTGNHLNLLNGKSAIGTMARYDTFRFRDIFLGLPVADLFFCGTGSLVCSSPRVLKYFAVVFGFLCLRVA